MIRFFAAGSFFLIAVAFVVAQDATPLEKLEPGKIPAAMRPGKGVPPETLANIAQRIDRCDCFAFRNDGKFFAISGPDQDVRIWNAEGLKLMSNGKQPDSTVCMAFIPDSKTLLVGDAGGAIRVLEKIDAKAPAGKVAVPSFQAHKDGPVWAMAVTADGKKLASGGRDRALKIWDLTKPKVGMLAQVTDHKDDVRGVAWSPDGNYLISVSPEEKQLRVWDTTNDKPKAGALVKLPAPTIGVNFSPDGSSVVLAGSRGTGAVWTFKDGKLDDPVDLDTEKRQILMANFSADGSLIGGVLAHSRTEDRVVVWTKDGKKKHEFKYDAHVPAAGFSPDSRHLVAVTDTGTYIIRLPK